MDTNRLSTSELTAALIIIIGLFIGSLGILDRASGADFAPVGPTCHDRYQITFKAVLHYKENDDG